MKRSLLPDSVHFIERDWLSCNQILMFDQNEATLVDTGFHKHRDMTVQLVAHLLASHQPNQRPARLARIINTHLHSDHCGANAALADAHDCEITIPAACEQAVRDWDQDELTFRSMRQHCDRFSASSVLNPGQRFVAGGLDWDVHAAPGHDPTSLVFFAAKPKILISADAFWENGFGLIFPELVDESGFAEQESVLDLIESLGPTVVLPGHGPIFTDFKKAMAVSRSRLVALRNDPKRNHRLALKALITFTMLDAERASLDELVARIDGGEVLTASAKALGMSLPEAINSTVEQLLAKQVLKKDGRYLLSS